MCIVSRSLNITPTWNAAMQILIAVLEDGTEKGKTEARIELMRLADLIDRQNEKDKVAA